MTMNASGPQVLESPRDREDLADGGGSAHTVAQATDEAHQVDALPIARPVPVQTSGRLEFAARCPECKTAPCGLLYVVQLRAEAVTA
ncbi:hypothetical protein ACGFX8_25245 [Streptomyces sp. NPDC048362]|uniref:hypothetical protein n=1 Tax=Streptomyces sp. NPDC048362 TaxID=3365539 RepID=UPI003723C819